MNLVPLYEEAIQFNNFNGTVLAAGKVEVWYLGRTRKADIYADVAGETPIPNPLDLNDLGMQEVYVNPAFNYTLVVYDPYGAELFSVDKYLQGAGDHTTSNVVVQPSEHIGVSAWTVGEVQIYQPYLVGEVGKTYEGISPIVVNNVEDKISAQHVPLGVQDPLYFVQDDEEGCIIGFSGQQVDPNEFVPWSASGTFQPAGDYQTAGDYYSASNPSGFITGVDLTPYAKTEDLTAYQPVGDYQTAGDYYSASNPSGFFNKESADTLYQEKGNYQTAGNYYSASNPSGFINSDAISSMATTGFVADVSADITAMIPTALTGDYLTKESADTLYQPTGNYQSALDFGYVGSEISSINGSGIYSQGGTANPQIPVTGINGIKISESGDKVVFEVSGDYYPGNNPSGFITGVDLSDYATTAELAGKQDITGMTAYQPVGNYQTAGDYLTTADSANFYTTANESGFITGVDLTPYQTVEGMTAYQPAGDYLTTGDSANFYTTANESGFISEVPAGTMNESAFEYNGSNKISAYNGSAFAGGGGADLDFGYDESGAISSINTSALSDSRAGTPLYVESPLFTGQSGDSAYIGWGYDDSITQLWTGHIVGTNSVTLSESIMNFRYIFVRGNSGISDRTPWIIKVDTENVRLFSAIQTKTTVIAPSMHQTSNGEVNYAIITLNQNTATITPGFYTKGGTLAADGNQSLDGISGYSRI